MKKLIIALAAGIAAMGAAQAQSTIDMSNYTAPRPYVGVGVSGGKNQASDDWRAGGKVFGGYNIDQNWAVELGYTHFGSRDYDTNVPSGLPGRASVKGNSSYVAAKYAYPLNERFSAYGKLGASYNERKNRVAGYGDYNERDTGLYGGLGQGKQASRGSGAGGTSGQAASGVGVDAPPRDGFIDKRYITRRVKG